jgi:glycosyltransferase involved in cell wall biosynthesis
VIPLTILHLAANRWWTGSADPVIRLARGLLDRGHRVLLGAIRGERFETKAREAGIPLLADLSLDARFSPGDLLRDIARLRRLVRTEGVQVIHTHHSHDHWLGALARGSAALVRTFHNARSVKTRWPATYVYGRTRALIAVTRQIEARCRAAGIPESRLFFVGGAVDLSRFEPSPDGSAIRREFGLGSAPVVGSVARLAPNRGHELLIRAFGEVVKALPDAKLLLVGKGEARPRLESMVVQLGLQRQIVFTGYRDQDLPAVLAAMDCFALMGAGSDESCRAALEAMAAGKPVVARKVGALPETVVDGETGLLLTADRTELLARALLSILADPERARRMGAAGKQRVEREFSAEGQVRRVEAVYRIVLQKAGRLDSPPSSVASGRDFRASP